jgi:hypothetical protein
MRYKSVTKAQKNIKKQVKNLIYNVFLTPCMLELETGCTKTVFCEKNCIFDQN